MGAEESPSDDDGLKRSQSRRAIAEAWDEDGEGDKGDAWVLRGVWAHGRGEQWPPTEGIRPVGSGATGGQRSRDITFGNSSMSISSHMLQIHYHSDFFDCFALQKQVTSILMHPTMHTTQFISIFIPLIFIFPRTADQFS
jgi:hypothetical protein